MCQTQHGNLLNKPAQMENTSACCDLEGRTLPEEHITVDLWKETNRVRILISALGIHQLDYIPQNAEQLKLIAYKENAVREESLLWCVTREHMMIFWYTKLNVFFFILSSSCQHGKRLQDQLMSFRSGGYTGICVQQKPY